MTNKCLMFTICLTALVINTSATIADENKKMTVFKTPWCGCCQVWTEAVEKAGFKVEIKHMNDLSLVHKQANVTDELKGCHTAVMGKYVLEGHVPLEAINKLLSERPDIRGIAVPGMPNGSLGMGYDKNAKYNVYSFTRNSEDKPKVYYKAGE